MNDSEFVLVYSTFPDEITARKAGVALIAAKLAACINILPPMRSLYEWEGKPEEAAETPVLIKTRRTLADDAIAAARALHPYSVPCFLILPVAGGAPDYLAWIKSQTVSARE